MDRRVFRPAYMQRYGMRLVESRRANIWLIVIGALGSVGLLLVWGILGNHIPAVSDAMTHWNVISNASILMLSLGMFNLVRRTTFHNRFINYTASLSLLIDIIYENLLLWTYVRPKLWIFTYEHFGYSHVLGWGVDLSVCCSGIDALPCGSGHESQRGEFPVVCCSV